MATSDATFYVGPEDEPDKYRLVHQVGSGGEAQLWKAELQVSGTWEPVAIKILRTDRMRDIDKWKARWAEQAEVLRFIRHPGVVGVREHFEGPPMHYAGEASHDQNMLYLAMNWVEGVPLRDWVPVHRTNEGYFESLRYLAQIGDVLDWLESGQATPSARPVIHADVTPANVIITGTGQAVLVDFGLTRLAAGTSPVVEGTGGYMAPEVIANGSYSPASDRYSFGALAYFVLTGQNAPADLEAVREGFSTVPVVAAQPGLVDHLMQMFNPDPAARPAAGEWIRFFRVSGSTTMGSPIGLQPQAPAASPYEQPEVMPLPPKKHRALVAGAIVLFILLAAGVGYAVSRGSGSPQQAGHKASKTTTTTRGTTVPKSTTTSTSNSGLSSSDGSVIQGSAGAPFFLSDTPTCCGSSENPNTGGATVNGQTFPHTIWDNYDECGNIGTTYTENYNLERQYRSFTATIGETDTSPLNMTIQWDVYLDGKHSFSKQLVQGQSVPINVDVRGVLTLTVTTTQISSASSAPSCDTIHAAWGDAEVLP